MKSFKKFFDPNFHIRFNWVPTKVNHNGTLRRTTVINVKVNDTKNGGEAEENWLLDYAYTLLKQPKEMDMCAKRWLEAFKNVKKKATLDILGHVGVTIPKANNNNIIN
jgi:hypothetical protein